MNRIPDIVKRKDIPVDFAIFKHEGLTSHVHI